jgi:hypothetical protein
MQNNKPDCGFAARYTNIFTNARREINKPGVADYKGTGTKTRSKFGETNFTPPNLQCGPVKHGRTREYIFTIYLYKMHAAAHNEEKSHGKRNAHK